MKEERLEELLLGYAEQRLTSPEMEELEALLRGSAEARRLFWQHMELETLLEDEVPNGAIESARVGGSKHQVWGGGWGWPLAVAACLTLLLSLGLWMALSGNGSSETHSADALATIQGRIGDVWDNPPARFLAKGDYELLAGMVDLDLVDGASVAIQGPAKFRLISGNRIELLKGRLGAHVPPGSEGFTVVTPSGRVVDHGTDFGVTVDEDGIVGAQLFNGAIEVADLKAPHMLQGSGALRFSREGILDQSDSSDPHAFPLPGQERRVEVVNGDFEPGTVPSFGPAQTAGVWSGDVVEYVRSFGAVKPHFGEGMLRFISCGHVLPPTSQVSSQHEQWIDLRQYAHLLQRGEVRLEVQAYFNRVPGDEFTDSQFKMEALAVRGDDWPRSVNSSTEWRTAYGAALLESDSDSETWELLAFDLTLPSDATFIRIDIFAYENVRDDETAGSVEFDGHFADSMRARLVVGPKAASDR